MRIPIINKTIQQRLHRIGIQGENNVEEIVFVLPRMYKDIDLSNGLAYIYITNAKKDTVVVKLQSEIEYLEDDETEYMLLKWLIGSEATQTKGMLNVQVVINGLNNELWKSEISTFTVSQSIDSPTTLPILYHSQDISPLLEEVSTEPPITISNRKFFIPSELKNIAVQNDENSEAVQIIMPRYFDGHDLSQYTICLKSVSQGGRGDVVFAENEKDILEKEIHLRWTLKPPQTSYAGTLQLQLLVTGPDFKWETDVGEVNILESLDADPVIPMTPSFIDDFLKQLQEYVNTTKTGVQTSIEQAQIAKDKAEEAKESASQAELNKNETVNQVAIAEEQANIATEQSNQAKTSASEAGQSAQSAADSAMLAQQIKDSTEVFYDIDQEGHRVGFRRADEQEFTYTLSLKGKDGTVSFDNLTEEQKAQLKGQDGRDGLTTSVTVNGSTYNHVDGNIILPDYPVSLPADGGNSDTLDGKHANEFADVNHTHEDLAEQINVLSGATILDLGADILSVVKDTNIVPLGSRRLLRVFNSMTSPDANNVNDFTYEVYRTTDAAYLTIIAYDTRTTREFTNKCLNGIWQGWQQIATTTKTPFSCTAQPGYEITATDCYILNNSFNITLKARKTDGSIFAPNVQHMFAIVPISIKNVSVGCVMGSPTAWSGHGSCFANSSRYIHFVTQSTNITDIYVTIRGEL